MAEQVSSSKRERTLRQDCPADYSVPSHSSRSDRCAQLQSYRHAFFMRDTMSYPHRPQTDSLRCALGTASAESSSHSSVSGSQGVGAPRLVHSVSPAGQHLDAGSGSGRIREISEKHFLSVAFWQEWKSSLPWNCTTQEKATLQRAVEVSRKRTE